MKKSRVIIISCAIIAIMLLVGLINYFVAINKNKSNPSNSDNVNVGNNDLVNEKNEYTTIEVNTEGNIEDISNYDNSNIDNEIIENLSTDRDGSENDLQDTYTFI